jgi:hypothetical protein
MTGFKTGTAKLANGFWRAAILVIVLFALINSSFIKSVNAGSNPQRSVTIANNQPFPIRMPVRIKGLNLPGSSWATSQNQPVQIDGEDAVFIADLKPSAQQQITFKPARSVKSSSSLSLNESNGGIALTFAGKDLGMLSWDIVLREVKRARGSRNGEPESTRADFASQFKALQMTFKRIAEGPVFDTWTAQAEKSGLQLQIELRAYHAGFLDIKTDLKNLAAPTTGVYAAVVSRWRQPKVVDRYVCYDNRVSRMGEAAWTGFRAGEGRHWFVQRGIDWVRTSFAGNTSVAWLNDFAEAFTVHQEATKKRPARWVGANVPQYGQEAQTSNGSVYSIIEIARSNIKSYLDRLEEDVLMPQGESVSTTSRLVFSNTPLNNERADQLFIAYAGYADQQRAANGASYNFGVPYVRFGTTYFPYSTLGENFDVLKLPGMDRDAYWPLAADTVKQWRLFADDIRRDLRIAKTMGFESIRLHHLELIAPLDKKLQYEYLDFLFSEMRHLGLRALLDVRLSAEDTAELVKRYRDLVDGVEIDNEVLIFGINDDAPAYWKRVYEAVKRVAPEVPVHLTSHTNTGAFDRVRDLGVTIDRFGLHSYMDSVDAIPSSRGFALAAASYGRREGKPPVITEWNWRGLTRMTEENRAKVYAPIFENVLKTRSVPVIYQFQFNESLAMNPRSLKGIRHYEPLWLSRRPKPEAFELARLIQQYAAPTHPNRLVDVNHVALKMDGKGQGTAVFRITNTSGRALSLHATVEAPGNVNAAIEKATGGAKSINLSPKASVNLPVDVQAQATDGGRKPLPGFYHVFLRLEGDNGLVRYGWAETRLEGEPQIDRSTRTDVRYSEGAMNFDLNRPLAVVYGQGAPIQDVETASVLVNTIESATGRPVEVYELNDLPADLKARGNLIVVGTPKTNSLIQSVQNTMGDINGAKRFVARVSADGSHGDWLVFSGADPLDAELAAMDFTIRFWKFAKDSAARRIGLVEKELPLGFDPAQLP